MKLQTENGVGHFENVLLNQQKTVALTRWCSLSDFGLSDTRTS